MGAGVEIGADLKRLDAELRMLDAMVEDNVIIARIRRDARIPTHGTIHRTAVHSKGL